MEQLHTEDGWVTSLALSVLIECKTKEEVEEIMNLERIKNGSW